MIIFDRKKLQFEAKPGDMGTGIKEIHWRFRLEKTKDLVFRNHIGNHVGCVMSKSPVVQTGVKGELSSSP